MKLLLTCLFMFHAIVISQIHENIRPFSFSLPLKRRSAVIHLPVVNHQKLLEEDDIAQKSNPFIKTIPRFGFIQNVNFTLKNSGFWENIKDKGRLWRLKLITKNAFYTNLIFSKFKIPYGSKLWIYNQERNSIIGAFTSKNNKINEKFSTSPLIGDTFWIEYFEPITYLGYGEIQLTKVIHGYKDIFSKTKGSSGKCNINVKCKLAKQYKKSSKSVVSLMTSQGSRFCTGTLINNLKQDSRQLLLTASHCLDPSYKEDVETWIASFQYQSSKCKKNKGIISNFTTSGMKLLAQNDKTDLLLLEIIEPIPNEYKAYLSGFDANEEMKTKFIYGIHHPSGDVKKISYSGIPLESYNFHFENSHWKVMKWENGTTEPGSSGSALFNDKEQIIGQLTGGTASCQNKQGHDIYGKLSTSMKIESDFSFNLNPDSIQLNLQVDGMKLLSFEKKENCQEACLYFQKNDCLKNCK
eukprot:gene5947-9776_t